MVRDDDRYVIGVDYGTLSGRALVVRVARRRRARLRGPRLPPRRARHASLPGLGPPPAARLGPAGARRLRRRAAHRRARPRSRRAGVDPAEVIGIATDFTACTMVPDARRRHPAVRAPRAAPTEPHAYVKLWKHHAAQGAGRPDQRAGPRARRAVARPLRRR